MQAINIHQENGRLIRTCRSATGEIQYDWQEISYCAFGQCGIRKNFRDYDTRKLWFQDNPTALEADVSPVMRFVADHDVEIQRPRRCWLDIESDSRCPFSRKAETTVLSWCIIGEDGRRSTGVLQNWRSEKQLVADLIEVMSEYDQVLAWNGGTRGSDKYGFDFPVVEARAIYHNLKIPKRLLFLDQLALYRRMNTASESGEEKTSYALDAIGRAILGEGKVDDFDSSKTYEAWLHNRDALLEYNIKDVELCKRIEEKTGFADILQAISETTFVFPDTRGLLPTRQVDQFMLRLARTQGFRLPSRVDRPEERYEGAYVMDPRTRGVERLVHVADFASLYPSIIRTLNASPETKGLPGFKAPLTGVEFGSEKEGMLPQAVRQLMDLRTRSNMLKASLPPGTPEWKDADRAATAYKVVANSFYGVMGSTYSRFFDRELAESITTTGKFLILETIKEAEAKSWRAIYADSITGDRTVVVKDAHGEVDVIPVEELWGRASGRFSRHDGKEAALLPGWAALARNAKGVEGWYPVSSIIRHKVSKKIWRVGTRRGQTEVTSDHGIMQGSESVGPEEFISRGASFDCLQAPQSEVCGIAVDLWKYLSRFSLEREYKGRTLRRSFALSEDPNWITLTGWGTPSERIRRWYSAGSLELQALLRLVGAYISEGSASLVGVTACRYMLSFSQNNEEWLNSLKRDLSLIVPECNLFGPHKTAGAYVLRSGTAAMSMMFAALCGYKSSGKKLPSFVYDLTGEDFQELWRLLVEGDGSVHRGKRSTQYSYTTISQRLIAGLSFSLSQHRIEHAIHFRPSKGSWTIRTRPSGSERNKKSQSVGVRVRETNDDEWVYDLSVEGANTFVDGVGRVLLHNTDSCFVTGCSVEEFSAFVSWCNADLYPRLLHGCRDNQIKLAYEKAFSLLIFPTDCGSPIKKRYCGAWSHYKGKAATADSKPEIKGLEYKRSDASRLTRRLQERVINELLADKSTLDDYIRLILATRDSILRDPIDLEDVVLSKSVKELDEYSTEPAHVRIAKAMLERGEDVTAGTRIRYVVTDGSCSPMKTIPASEWTGECDRRYTWNSSWPATMRLLSGAFPNHNWRKYSLKKKIYTPPTGQTGFPGLL